MIKFQFGLDNRLFFEKKRCFENNANEYSHIRRAYNGFPDKTTYSLYTAACKVVEKNSNDNNSVFEDEDARVRFYTKVHGRLN